MTTVIDLGGARSPASRIRRPRSTGGAHDGIRLASDHLFSTADTLIDAFGEGDRHIPVITSAGLPAGDGEPGPARHPGRRAAQLVRLRRPHGWTGRARNESFHTPALPAELGLFTTYGMTGPGFLQPAKDQFDQLHADSAGSGRVMALARAA